MTTQILTSAQVKNLLTRADLEKLEEQIATGTLKAEVVNDQAIITYKNDRMALFDVLSLIGTL